MTYLLKSRYRLNNLQIEDILSFQYEATDDQVPNRRLMVFQYKSEFLNADLIKRLMKLAQVLSQLRHPRLLPLVDYHYDGKYFFVVYLLSESLIPLEEFLQGNPDYSREKLSQESRELVSVYRFLNEGGVRCGSINLNGIYVNSEGHWWVVKAGLPIEILKMNWQKLDVIEDCLFYAPEFLLQQEYDERSDIYAYGVLLHYVLSRKWPFPFTHHIKQIAVQAVPSLETGLSTRVFDMIAKCLQQNPYDRFSTFSDLIHAYFSKDPIRFTSRPFQQPLPSQVSPVKVKRRVQWWILLGISIVLLVFLGYGYYRYVRYITAIPESAVPNVVGMSKDEAIELLKKHQLIAEVAAERVDYKLGAGIVIQTKPAPGMTVKQSRVVKLVVTKSASHSGIPNLMGRSKADVEDLLSQQGLPFEFEEVASEFAPGTVVDQFPSANQLIKKLDKVRVSISRMPRLHLSVMKTDDVSSKARMVSLDYEIFSDMKPQLIEVFLVQNQERTKVTFLKEEPGKSGNMMITAALGNSIEVYFNKALVYQGIIKDNVLND